MVITVLVNDNEKISTGISLLLLEWHDKKKAERHSGTSGEK